MPKHFTLQASRPRGVMHVVLDPLAVGIHEDWLRELGPEKTQGHFHSPDFRKNGVAAASQPFLEVP